MQYGTWKLSEMVINYLRSSQRKKAVCVRQSTVIENEVIFGVVMRLWGEWRILGMRLARVLIGESRLASHGRLKAHEKWR